MGNQPQEIRVHLTNVAGAGATRLLQSLLPALERDPSVWVTEILLPDRGELAHYKAKDPRVSTIPYRRHIPNALSRFLECTVLGSQFTGVSPLLVLGDLPLRCSAPQTLFVQTPHLAAPSKFRWTTNGFKFAIARWIFQRNARYVRAFIVQTPVMKSALANSYPPIADRIHVVAQPVPSWLLDARLVRHNRKASADANLSLVYPAANYPHKNHRLLGDIVGQSANSWPIESLTLTIPADQTPAPRVPWVKCCGFLSPERMIDLYQRADAVLFLSTDESYGFPLVEAMFVGLPIICPDLPYARTLCGNGAIYFDPRSIDSLEQAILTLRERLRAGWWPDWSSQLTAIPRDWQTVATAMLTIALGGKAPPAQPMPDARLF